MLMNKDKQIALINIEENNIKVIKKYKELPKYLLDNKWLNERVSLYARQNILNIAKMSSIYNKEDFANIVKAISVTDTFWLNNIKNSINWSKINPYKNKISKIIANLAIDGFSNYSNIDIKSPSPQYRIDGVTDKCVKRVNGDLLLYKTSGEKWSELAGLRPYSEYFASIVANELGIKNYVSYNIKEVITNNGYIKPYSICKIFTDEYNGLIQICDTTYGKMETEELARKLNKDMLNSFKEMAILDSITLNMDRHKGNYGFIINNDTLKIKGMAPIYDNDCSLGSLTSLQYKSFEEAYRETKRKAPSLGLGGYNGMAKWAMTKDIYNRLKSIKYIKLERKFKGLSEKRVKFIEYIINRRIKEIIELFE